MSKRYPLASILRRFFARTLDLILLFGISAGIFFLLFGVEDLHVSFKSYLFFIFVILIFILFIFYFILIPFFTNGRTLFIWIFNMQIYNINNLKYNPFKIEKNNLNKLSNVIYGLFKREFFIWNIISFINIILGIVILSLGNVNGLNFLKSIFLANSGNYEYQLFNPYSIIFTSLYSINFIILILILINAILNSKKRNIIDIFSSTITIYLKEDLGPIKKNVNIKQTNLKKYGLPLEILDSVFEELDDLREEDEK